ncbi:MAG: dihydrodipicolinate synthase family protein [Gemmatimonadetes bacterium]|jgi:dihydrodipicolinate synthase/N-acetylneuraminate lyase|nr:dihydrodipicolinate synthase family protein [Gemmatimonadota bacterium]
MVERIEFRGVFPAIITPMTPEGALNEEAFRRVVEFNIQAGVQGFWVAGGTGESVLLEDEENMRLAEIAADQSGGRAINIMHVGAATTARAAKLAEHAARVGVESICCVPPFFYGRTDEEIVEHYRVVAAAADLPLFVYNLPSSTGVEITPRLMQKIQEKVPQLAGLKHSAPSFVHVHTFAEMGLCCLIGSCRLMLPALAGGANGCVDGPPNMLPELWVDIWKAYLDGDWPRAAAAQKKARDTFDDIASIGGGFHALVKAALSERLGIDCGAPRLPAAPLTDEQRTALGRRLRELGLVGGQ